MVRSARFELTAFGSGGQRSIQLSYERIRTFLICFVLAAVKASRQGHQTRSVARSAASPASPAIGVGKLHGGSLLDQSGRAHVLHLCGYSCI